MKRTIILAIAVLLAIGVQAQSSDDYRSLVEEGKRWTYDNYVGGRPDKYNHYYWYFLQGDTIINGKTCLKMFSENEHNDDKIIYKGALYEENKKVYHINNDGKFVLLYDFDCREGDEIQVKEGIMKVVKISTIEDEGRTLRVYELSSKEFEDEYMHIYWIEGIGCMQDFFAMMPYPGNYCSLVRCEVNDEVLYQYVQPKYTEEGYHEMAIEGKTWNYIHHYEDETGIHEEPYSYVVKGDTVIGRTNCKKLYYQDSKTERFVCALWETGRDLMKRPSGSDSWHRIYQFGRTDIGRVFDWDSKQGAGRVFWMLHDRDTITVNGTDFYRLTFYSKTIQGGTTGMLTTIEDGPDVWHEIWVEGVGSELNGIEDPVHERPLNDKDYTRFVSCYENGVCIFTANDFRMEKPDPSPYRPFIEMGKVWRTGINPGDGLRQQYEYRFYEDSIIGGKTCKVLGKSELEILSGGSYRTKDTTYVAALYESGQKVYLANPDKQEFILLYDFASPVGTDITVLSVPLTITRKEKSQEPEFKGMITELQSTRYEDAVLFWLEGVGSWGNPLESLAGIYPTGVFDETPISSSVGDEILISCAVGDEILYLLHNELDTPSEVKKHWLDFTHTTKPRPKSPKLAAGGESDADKAAEQETLTGEYSAKELFVSLKTLAGPYVITLTDAAGKEVYRKEVQTSNVVALNTDLTKYAAGQYTLTVENSEEQYTASLFLPLIDDAVRDLQNEKSVNGKSVNSKWLDLSGRRLNAAPTRPGLYIVGDRKVVIK